MNRPQAVTMSVITAIVVTALVTFLSVREGMPVWAAVSVELSTQAGCWGAVFLDRAPR